MSERGPSVRVVLDDTGFGLRAAVVAGDRLIEVRDVDSDDAGVTDALFVARVTRVEPKLNAAFLDCGLASPGFLAAKDARALHGAVGRPAIRDLVREGQTILVQGLREASDDKGPRFTTDVRLFGLAMVHRPLWGDPSRLGERERALFPHGKLGLRRHASGIDDAPLLAEAATLAERWSSLSERVRSAATPGRVADGDGLVERMLKGLLDLAPDTIEVADTTLHAQLRRLVETAGTLPPFTLERLPDDRPAFVAAGVDDELQQAMAPQVPLRGGGRLQIEPTAALTAVDVDGGGRAPLDIDLAAVAELALQLRLRNIGGTVVVDFVDLATRHERQRVEDALKRAVRTDPLPVQVYGMSPLGLVELSRARRGRPLAELFLRACPTCAGVAAIPSLRLRAEALVDRLRRATAPVGGLRVAPDLARWLERHGAAAWRRARDRYAPTLAVEIDRDLKPGAFAIG